MTSEKIKNRISEIASHFTFEYHKKSCGIDPYSKNDFEMWCGDKIIKVSSIDDVMDMPFFDGKSLSEISDELEIIDW